MRQVRRVAASRGRAAYPMTVHTRLAKEGVPPGPHVGLLHGRLPLVGQPGLEVARGLDDDPEEHVGVLGAAILGALAEVQAGAVSLEPHAIGATRDQVGLAAQPGYPEAVAHVRGLQGQVDRAGYALLAGRDVQLVGRREAQLPAVVTVVAVLPPPLAADHGDE